MYDFNDVMGHTQPPGPMHLPFPQVQTSQGYCVVLEAAATTLKGIVFTGFLVAPPSTTLYIPSSYSAYSQVYICYTKSLLQVQ